jgi:phosphoglycerate dehydrogenase-like enzyme
MAAEALGQSQGLIVGGVTRVGARMLALAPYLHVVGRLGSGLENLDLDLLRTRRVLVTAAQGGSASSVAEYVVGAMLHFSRRLDLTSRAVRGGSWDREVEAGFELAGRTLGVVGLSESGRRVATIAAALEMRLLVYDPVLDPEADVLARLGARLLPLEHLVREADVVTLHTPLTAATRGLIGADEFAVMKPGAILVNAAHGELVDEHALAGALGSGRLGGAALDVRAPEPPAQPDPLAGFADALLTPRIAGRTRESAGRTARMVAEDVIRALRGEVPRGVVR